MKIKKVVIITILSCYIIVVSFLFIKTSIDYSKKMNKKIVISYDSKYEKAIEEDRKKLEKYKKVADEKDLECLNNVEEMIDFYYGLNHPKKGITYKEYSNKIYGLANEKHPFTYEYSPFTYLGNVVKACYETNEDKGEFINKIMGSVIYYQENYNPLIIFGINTNISINEEMIYSIAYTDFESSKKKIRQTDELINNDNQIEGFDLILKKVGDRYDEK